MNRNKITQKTYNSSADHYFEKVQGSQLYNTSYDHFCTLLPKDASVLELGCGPGNVTQYMMQKRPDVRFLGIDVAQNMVALAKKNNPNAEFLQMDCRKLNRLDQKFDAVLAAFVFPYLNQKECSELIGNFVPLLSAQGLVYISTMEGSQSSSGYEHTSFGGENLVYINYHQDSFIKNTLLDQHFEILKFMRQDCQEPDGRTFNDLIYIARKNKEIP